MCSLEKKMKETFSGWLTTVTVQSVCSLLSTMLQLFLFFYPCRGGYYRHMYSHHS